jgi:putative endopeptidase
MRYLKLSLAAGILLAFSLAFARVATQTAQPGFDFANLDRSVKACVDFDQFASGGWTKANPIPPEYPRWGTFNILAEHNRDVLHEILEQAAKNTVAPAGSNERKVGDYYASCMDGPQIEAQGLKPLQPELDRIAALHDLPSLRAEVERLQSLGVNAIFQVGSIQDFKDSTRVIGGIDQGGLGMPDRDYYLKTDDKSKLTRQEYVHHVTKIFELMGDAAKTAAGEAQTVMNIETQLAKASLTRVERRNPDNVYHKMNQAQVQKLAPEFDWPAYFEESRLTGKGDINVTAPDFFRAANGLLTSVPLAGWKTYLRWHLLSAAAPALPDKFVQEDFNFNGRILTGAKEILPRWKRCVRSTDDAIGMALGEMYVARTFSPQSKAHALEMVHNLEAALRADIHQLDWMGLQTKKAALAKLDAIVNKIGYPDKWRDYSKLSVDRGPYVENLLRANLFEFDRDLAKVGKPVDRTEWLMTPSTVNAYYNPLLNEIVFPAGILQPPFFDAHRDDAYNYGGVGAVIGHELTHGFDDQGSKFDAQGNLRNWWTPQDKKNFDARAECVIKQFDSYEVQPGLYENGKLVAGESIADLGGLAIAYMAYQHSLERKPQPPAIEGFTPQQRFFLGYAQVWAGNIRPQLARLQVNTDPHPIAHFRVNGPLSNLNIFAQAFGCKAPDPMVRPEDKRCRIW